MSHLSKLKIVAQAAKRQQTKTEHRRGKLLEKLDDQLAMVQALIDGEIFTRNRRVWQKNETGERVLVERVKRTCSATIWMRTQRQSGRPFWRSQFDDDCRGATITHGIFVGRRFDCRGATIRTRP